jgi:hypothetical protein
MDNISLFMGKANVNKSTITKLKRDIFNSYEYLYLSCIDNKIIV